MRPKSPIYYAGGKQKLAKKLIALMPPHHTYVEVFGGGGSVLFNKPAAAVEVYNDINPNIANFMSILNGSQEQFELFCELVASTPYSREIWHDCRDTVSVERDPVKRAQKLFALYRYSFAGKTSSFGIEVARSSRGRIGISSSYQSALAALPYFRNRLLGVKIECADFRDIIPRYDCKDTLFYLDPPYMACTRREMDLYPYETSDTDHEDLIELCRNIEGKVILSGYDNKLYNELGWRKIEWKACCHMAGRTKTSGLQGLGNVSRLQQRVECVWLNF